MEASGGNSDEYRGSSVISSSNSRRYEMQLLASNFFHSPLSTLLEYSGILRTRIIREELFRARTRMILLLWLTMAERFLLGQLVPANKNMIGFCRLQ
ncbi:hypothetical protein CsSME_00032184 [Camellia sinensis var. sinensis]